MKQKDIAVLVMVGFFAAIVSFVVAGSMFSPKKYSAKVPTVDKIEANFPDVKNDPVYKNFINPNSIDLTVPVKIGGP